MYMIDCHGISFCSGHESMLQELPPCYGATSEVCGMVIPRARLGGGGVPLALFHLHTWKG